jgi:hypothetical protein
MKYVKSTQAICLMCTKSVLMTVSTKLELQLDKILL